MEQAPVDRYRALPRCEGPKLHCYKDQKPQIKFISLLSSDANQGSTGTHGYVFKVLINSEPFALKIFKFYDPTAVRDMLTDSQNAQVTDDILVGHMDPFYAECRAYGRITERQGNRKRSIAVPCHGFLSIPASHEAMLAKDFSVSTWDRPAVESTLDPNQRQPFRALVKDLVEDADDIPISSRQLGGMLRDLRALRRIGVYPMDVCARNYRSGRLVDFSIAWTTPHFMFRVRPRWQIDRLYKQLDLVYFDAMVEELGISTTVRATPNQEYNKRLRPKKR